MSYSSHNKFSVLQEKVSAKKSKLNNRNKTSNQKSKNHKNIHRNSPSNRNRKANYHSNSPSNHNKHYDLRKEKTFNHKTISIKPHNGCINNSCCSIHCDLVDSKYQSSYLRITIHLSNIAINDAQLITLTQTQIIPQITKYIENQKERCNQDTLNRVIISLYLNENNLCGNGCVPLLNFIDSHNFRILTLQLFKNSINDKGCTQICNVLKHIKYPLNEIHLEHNKITNIGFNAIIDLIKYRNDNDTLLSYPSRVYKIKCQVIMQDLAPFWIRIEDNYINTKDAAIYMKTNNITLCYALNKRKSASLGCDPLHCIDDTAFHYYQNELNTYNEKQMFMNHSNYKCKVCSRARNKKGKKVILCKKCKEKAKLIDAEEQLLTTKVDGIMKDNKLNMDDKIKAMEELSQEQDLKHKTAVKPWIWGEDDTETSNDDKDENINELEKEFFVKSICALPDNFTIPMIHLHKFKHQLREPTTNEKVAFAQTLLLNNENEEEKKSTYFDNMVSLSSTPLFIMCDTCSILRMVGLKKKSVMNYWETMLTATQKIKYILHFTVRDTLEKGKFLLNSEMYQRKLRIEILPRLQLHLNTEEIKLIANDLMKVPFKKLFNEKQKKKKYDTYVDKYQDIIKCQMYRFVALFEDKLPQNNASKHIWQQRLEQYVFNELGFECPQQLMPRFITEIRKLRGQYQHQNKLENAKMFTLNTLIQKAENGEFGFNIETKSEQNCILIPNTVTLELEHIKTTKGNKSKGDLWRVQQLCGSKGLLETLCKQSGCDLLCREHGEDHLESNSLNNDYTIISVAQHYSKLLNTESNLGFVLLTNDKAMHTIASAKGIPVVSLEKLNKKLQQDQVDTNINKTWNASYLREIFIKVGFVAGFAQKYLINDAVNLLKSTKNLNVNMDESMIKELEVRRKQVSSYKAMEHRYATELFESMTLTNELMVTLRDILKNRDSATIMKQIYTNKVDNLEIMVRESHKKWSAIIGEFQSRQIVVNNNNIDAQDMKDVDANNNNSSDEDSDMPPPLNEADQQKLLEMKRKDENNTNDKDALNANVPLVGGYLAGEELFSRQANNDGFEEEVVIMSQD